ncbi:MAG: hypothetical protein GC193_10265, partial [Cryomorphaceae bacterium]|nr:hypothetical protein [Cryomorphaceae bacterium]
LFVHCSQVVHGAQCFDFRTFKILNTNTLHDLFIIYLFIYSVAQRVIVNDPFCVQTTWDNFCQNAFNICIPSGCTDANACNFDPTAVNNDGSCSYGTNLQIISISLSNINCAGGQLLDVTGIDLCGIVSVSILGQELTFTSFSNTHLQCITPPGSGNTDLKITTLAGITSFPISYNPPIFSSIAPLNLNCSGGTSITIVGSNLCNATVLFNGNITAVSFNSSTAIIFFSPPGSGIANIEIVTPTGSFQTNIAYNAPQISAVSTSSIACDGSFVLDIVGSNLCNAQVFIGTEQANVLTNTATVIHCTTTPGTGSVSLTIVTPSGISNELTLNYIAPALTGLSIANFDCLGGQSLVILGSNLCESILTIGGIPVPINSNSSTQISATIPPGSGDASVVVTSASGVSNTLNAQYSPLGCTDASACNFDPSANCDDGNCLYLDCNGDCGGLAILDDCNNCIVPDISEFVNTFTALAQEQSFTVPQHVDRIIVELYGASGGQDFGASLTDPIANGGLGGYVYGEMDVNSNIFFINVGRRANSYNGGGGGFQSIGGGASDIRQGGNAPQDRIVVAGGGGGGRFNGIAFQGGAGGGFIGGDGNGPAGEAGTGGNQSAGGTGLSNGNGSSFSGGFGQAGGGGGWFGGGAGQDGSGGGGSSYLGNLENAYTSAGVNDGEGYVIIKYYLVEYSEGCIQGCTSSLAVNFDSHATSDNGNCIFVGCNDPLANNYNSLPTLNDGSCIYNEGCTYLEATNYQSLAVLDNGTCTFETSPACVGDLNGDGAVNGADLLSFLGAFGTVCN